MDASKKYFTRKALLKLEELNVWIDIRADY
jgi:hypothetical protein